MLFRTLEHQRIVSIRKDGTVIEITKDLGTQNGIKASENKNFVFLTMENIEESYRRIIEEAPFIHSTVGKNYIFVANSVKKLLTKDGVEIDPTGTIVKVIGYKYLIVVTQDSTYKIIDVDGNVLEDNISYLYDDTDNKIALLRDDYRDIVVTPQKIIIKLPYQCNIVASLEDGTFFTKSKTEDEYCAWDSEGVFLESGDDLIALKYRYFNPFTKNHPESHLDVYQNYIINNFKSCPSLKNYNAENLLDMLNKAASLPEDFCINLNNGEVYQTTFKHLLKISNDTHCIWIPNNDEEIKAMEDFCLKRRKEYE